MTSTSTGTLERGSRARPGASAVADGLQQAAIVGTAFVTYMVARVAVEGDEATARANAQRILDLEATLGIDWELGAQRVMLDHPGLITVWNAIYQWLYWPFVLLPLVWLWARQPATYRRLRDGLVIAAVCGVVVFALAPTAPPRFLGPYVDTLTENGLRAGGNPPWANVYAAMPSFHVGWIALAAARLGDTVTTASAKVALAVPVVLMAAAVVVTGNHYVLDVVAGLVIVALADAVAVRARNR